MKKALLVFVVLMFAAAVFLVVHKKQQEIISPVVQTRTWETKSVDTMKYSRDLSAQVENDPTFDTTIDAQVKGIAATGANTVAIATPYDTEFVPVLGRWVAAARRYNLRVWFRGNFSGWEGWFGRDASLTRSEHIQMTRDFITSHPDLFRDGDIFSPCPECENGGPGDPRKGDVSGFRQFMIDEKQACDQSFSAIKKKVNCGYFPMNFDVAKLVMDEDMAKAMGGVVVIDHYVKTPDILVSGIDNLAKQTNAKIFLGETGVPVPDIHGQMTDQQQADWLEEALGKLARDPNLIGLNYWTSVGGSTAIFKDDMTPKPAAEVITKYFHFATLPN